MAQPILNGVILRSLLVIVPLLCVVASTVQAQQVTTELDGPRLPEELLGKIDFLLDPTNTMAVQDILVLPGTRFEAIKTESADFGYIDSDIWLRTTVKNVTPDITSWRIHFRENFKQRLAVHIVRADNSVDTVYDVGIADGFEKRPIQYPEMVAPMQLVPGETATVYIRYWSEGSSQLAFGFETEISFATRTATRTAKNFLFYGTMILPVLIAFLAFILYRQAVFAAYVLNWVAALLYVMHSDGVTFQYLWPGNPAWNSFASIPLGAGIIIMSPIFARVFLNTRLHNPLVDKLLWAVILVATAMLVSSVFLDGQVLKKLLVLMSLISVSACALSGLVAAFTRFKQVRFFVIAWAGFFGAAIIMSMRHWLGIEISQDFQNDAIRSVMVFDAILMGLSIADRNNQLRQSRQKALAQRYDEETRNLKLLARLSELEKRYVQETAGLRNRDNDTSDTLHDLQQPLTALRLNLRGLVDGKLDTPEALEDMESSFAYIERLMAAATRHRDDSAVSDSLKAFDKESSSNAFGLRKVTDSVMQMFLPDAAAKGLDLRYYPSDHDIAVQPLAAMRIISNILSNAIKFTDSGRILLCVRRRGDDLRVEIHDSGPGLNAAQFEQAKERRARLDITSRGTPGEGLGLSIAHMTAEKSGYGIHKLCERKSGLSVGITFPLT
ncbi:MAG: sensor histidine kinase [Sulfitobacter sp.]